MPVFKGFGAGIGFSQEEQPGTNMRQELRTWLEQSWVRNVILGVILFNAAILGLETSDTAKSMAGGLIDTLDTICLAIFTIEILLKLYAYGRKFPRDGWRVGVTPQ